MANNPSQKHMVREKTKLAHYLFSYWMFLLLKKGWIDLIAKMAHWAPPPRKLERKKKKSLRLRVEGTRAHMYM